MCHTASGVVKSILSLLDFSSPSLSLCLVLLFALALRVALPPSLAPPTACVHSCTPTAIRYLELINGLKIRMVLLDAHM